MNAFRVSKSVLGMGKGGSGGLSQLCLHFGIISETLKKGPLQIYLIIQSRMGPRHLYIFLIPRAGGLMCSRTKKKLV